MINFQELQDNIHDCGVQQKAMSATLARLEETVATLATKSDVAKFEARTKDELSKHSRQIESLELTSVAHGKVVDEMPTMQRGLQDRMAELEQKMSADLSGLSQKLGGRLGICESEVRAKGSLTEMRALAVEVEDRTRREETDKLQYLINKVRDEVSTRIDDIGERTSNMRKDLDTHLDMLTAQSEAITSQVQERTKRLEDESTEVQIFLAKCEVRASSDLLAHSHQTGLTPTRVGSPPCCCSAC